MAQLYANPYGHGCTGWYFSSLKEYEAGVAKHARPHAGGSSCEEHSIEFIDGDATEVALWEAVQPGPADLERWFDEIEFLTGHDAAAVVFAGGVLGYSDVDDILRVAGDVDTYPGSAEDYIHEFVDDVGIEGADPNGYYFDYEAFGRDLRFGDPPFHGDDAEDVGMTQEEYDREQYRVDNLSDADLAYEYIDNLGSVSELGPDTIKRYFDYAAMARDAEINGDINEFDFGGDTVTVTNAAAV